MLDGRMSALYMNFCSLMYCTSAEPMCRSFSWKKSTDECLWSLEAIHFDSEFDFFAKTNPEAGSSFCDMMHVLTVKQPSGAPFTYYEFLGVRYQETGEGFSKKFPDLDIDECRAKCDAERERHPCT